MIRPSRPRDTTDGGDKEATDAVPGDEPPAAGAALGGPGRQASFWDWLEPLKQNGTCLKCYVKVGRGAILVLDVDTHETLHRLMTEWANCVPAELTVFPLIDPSHQEEIARRG